ncbi:hypothetical protein Droror1_Dr00022060 [Drosera rotundifolia]
MVKLSRALMKQAADLAGDGGGGLNKFLAEVLVCPLTKSPLRYCEETETLISDRIGVSFPIVDGIPCLVPKDGKILEDDESQSAVGHGTKLSSMRGQSSKH